MRGSPLFPFECRLALPDSRRCARTRYVNGIDFDGEGALHVSWTWRDYVPVTLEQSRQQAGPNGPENVSV